MNVIETTGLTKTFKAGKKIVEAVRGVDMQVAAGEIFGFLGPNGAGKTTTQRMLTTLLDPTSGEAMIAGHDLRREPGKVRTRIGYVSQAGGTDLNATGRENLMLQARLYGMTKAQGQARIATVLPALELDAFADRLARTYSGGQRRRLDLALGMIHQPRLLFLDEPTTGLDPQSRVRLWDEVRLLRDAGTTIFLTTHYLDEADALCDRLAIMDEGTIVAQGTPNMLKRQIAGDIVTLGFDTSGSALRRTQEIFRAQPFVREVMDAEGGVRLYVEHGEEALPLILRMLDGEGLNVQTIALTRPTLDDVFLRQTGRSLRESLN